MPDPNDTEGLPLVGDLSDDQRGWIAGRLPPATVRGEPNPEYTRARYFIHTYCDTLVALGRYEYPKGYNPATAINLLRDEMKLYGWDPKHVLDTRTEAQRWQDVLEQMQRTPDAILEQMQSLLDRVREEQRRSVTLAAESFMTMGGDRPNEGPDEREQRQKKSERWACLLDTLSQTRRWALEELPDDLLPDRLLGETAVRRHALRSSHVLRFMLYVGRSSMNEGTDSRQGVFRIAQHHADFARTIYMTFNDLVLTKSGGVIRAKQPWAGCVLVAPVRHGKTNIVSHQYALWLNQRPGGSHLFTHAREDEAAKSLTYVASYFTRDEANGRRNLSLFPNGRIVSKAASRLLLKSKEAKKQRTLEAGGISAKVGGADADTVWADDVVDSDAVSQESERNRTARRLSSQWFSRLTGKHAKYIVTATLWHYDDAVSRLIHAARSRKIQTWLCIRRTGGPEDGFRPLWADVYPASWLRAKYNEWKDPRLFSAVFQANPMPESLRQVKRLRFYDPASPQHREFMESFDTTYYVSVDPAATAHDKSDKASFVWGAMGDVASVDGDVEVRERRVRILDARQFHATPVALVEEIGAFMSDASTGGRLVNYVLIESRGNTVADLFQQTYGVTPVYCDPGNASKTVRLKQVASMLDDSLQDKGLDPAVVEFPGARDEETGKLVCHPEYQWLSDQIILHGVSAEDHGLDAVTQLCRHVAPDIGVGGNVTAKVVRRVGAPRNERLASLIREMEQEKGRSGNDQFWRAATSGMLSGR